MDLRNKIIHCEWLFTNGELRNNIQIKVHRDGRIEEIGEELSDTPDFAFNNQVVLPGMVSAHSHAFHRGMRGRSTLGRAEDDEEGDDEASAGGDNCFWRWRDAMYAYVDGLTTSRFYDVCRDAFAEMLATGITTVGEFHYLHHGRPAATMHAGAYDFDRVILKAAKDVNIRYCWRWRDVMYAYVDGLMTSRFYDVCRDAFAEMLATSITTVGEFHYLHHGRPAATMHAGAYDFDHVILKVAKDVNIRYCWRWRDVMYAYVDGLMTSRFYDVCRDAFAEMLTAGITTVGEFHYLHHGWPTATMHAGAYNFDRVILKAAKDVNIRYCWHWRDVMYAYVDGLMTSRFYDVCRDAFAEMLAAGITTVVEFHYLHHGRPATTMHAGAYDFDRVILKAAKDVNIRIVLLETLYRQAGVEKQALSNTQRRFTSESVEEFWGNFDKLEELVQDEPTQTIGVAAHSIRAVNYDDLLQLRKETEIRQLPFHMHLEEQPKEIEDSVSFYGKRPMTIVLDKLTPNERFTAVHATYTTEQEMQGLINTDANICLCPLTEGYLGDGVPNLPQLDTAQRPFYCLGSDCNNRLCLFEEGRWFTYCQQMKTNKRGINSLQNRHLANDLLAMATENGARSLGLADDCGKLEVGYWLDFFTVDLTHRTFKGVPPEDIVDALFFSASADSAAIKHVCVGGQITQTDKVFLSEAVAPSSKIKLDDTTVESFLVSLMKIDSTTGSEGKLATILGEYLKSHGWYVKLQPLKNEPHRMNILATREPFDADGGFSPEVVFNSHLDTVPPYIPPSSNKAGLIKGRGSNDAKGQLAALLFAANQIYREDPKLGMKIGLLFVVDEEYTHLGMTEANELGLCPKVLVVAEPTELQFARRQKGALKVSIICEGKAAHSGYPHKGKSALEPLLDILQDLRKTEWPSSERLGETTLNIGRLEAGQALNALPASAHAQLFFRVVTNPVSVFQQLSAVVAGRATRLDAIGMNAPVDLDTLDGYPSQVVAFNTDIPYFHMDRAVTKVFLFGAGSITDAHSDDEFVRADDVVRAVMVYCEIVRQTVGVRNADEQ